jgi:hypothetical protein
MEDKSEKVVKNLMREALCHSSPVKQDVIILEGEPFVNESKNIRFRLKLSLIFHSVNQNDFFDLQSLF